MPVCCLKSAATCSSASRVLTAAETETASVAAFSPQPAPSPARRPSSRRPSDLTAALLVGIEEDVLQVILPHGHRVSVTEEDVEDALVSVLRVVGAVGRAGVRLP